MTFDSLIACQPGDGEREAVCHRQRRRPLTERGWFQTAVVVGLIAIAFGLAALAIIAAGLMTGAGA